MSKHDKQVRRERKKTDRARRRGSLIRNPQSAIRNGAAALAAAAVIAAGTQAYAAPVRYDNLPEGAPGWFDWKTPNPEQSRRWLDVMEDVANQPLGVGDLSAFGQTRADLAPYGQVTSLGGALQVGGYYDYFVAGVNAGDMIPSGLTWAGMGYVYSPVYGTATPEGVPTYLGVRFDLGGGYHYGWIGAVRTGTQFDAFAWGYETTPGVSIPAGIPEPGTLALLAFGALAIGRRRA